MRLKNKDSGVAYDTEKNLKIEIDDEAIRVTIDNPDGIRIVGIYGNLSEFCKEWEDVKEPIIKDEKIRKAIRAWAEAVGVDKLKYEDTGWHYDRFKTEIDEYDHFIEINFWHKIDADLENGHIYTIEELCGEEKE